MRDNTQSVVVCGGGGFIGGHLVGDLIRKGFRDVKCVDVKPKSEWYQVHPEAQNVVADLNLKDAAFDATKNRDVVINLACNMGGMGFIEHNKGLCMISVLINTHLLMGAKEHGAKRFFYASSACVYNADKQKEKRRETYLKEEDAYPAMAEDGYGWEKLFSERMCRHFREDFGLATRVARYHNVYGPHGTWEGGREKAPAAICRKVLQAKHRNEPESALWGDGSPSRSFMYIDDCIRGTLAIADSQIIEPINLGSSELVTINELVSIVEEIAGVRLKRTYNLQAPKGVNGRNSDNSMIRRELGWEPSTRLRDGMERTYRWIHDEYVRKYGD